MRLVERWFYGRGWIACDEKGCHRVIRPRWLAYHQGWWCGGTAGHYDLCPTHKESRWIRGFRTSGKHVGDNLD